MFEYDTAKTKFEEALEDYKGGISIVLTKNDLNQGRFALFHYPVLIYNSILKTILTKDVLSQVESNAFARHLLLNLNRKTEELSNHVRDFARYVIETMKPGSGFLKSKWVLVIIIIFMVVLGIIFLPTIIDTVTKGMPGINNAFSNAVDSGSTIVPQ